MFQKVAIIGAGPAGLAAAKALKQYPNLSTVIFEAKSTVGGLWATSDSESTSVRCPPWLRTNLSRLTCSFSDLAWRTTTKDSPPRLLFPKAPEVQKYLQDYASCLSKDTFRFNTRVTGVEHTPRPDQPLWTISFLPDGGGEVHEHFDFVIVASGFFARPWIPQPFLPFSRFGSEVSVHPSRVLHSSEYSFDRVLSLFNADRLPRKTKIVVIGGSLSAVEVVSDLCLNVNSIRPEASSADRTPGEHASAKDMANFWEIIHVAPRPFWVVPRFLPQLKPAESDNSPPKFLPLDLIFYDASKFRNLPRSSSDAPPSDAERFFRSNANFRTLLGYQSLAQADLSPNLEITEENGWMSRPPWVTISDTYANFLREKKARFVIGHAMGADITNADDSRITLTLSPNSTARTITEVDAIISCTGYTPSLDKFLSPDLLRAMEYSASNLDSTFLPAVLPQQMFLPCSTDLPHPGIRTTIGFVGMYKGPYFGVIELQARYLAALFARELPWPSQESLSKDAEAMRSIRRSRERGGRTEEEGNGRRAQWSWGDYMQVMKGLAERLGVLEGSPLSASDSPSTCDIDPVIPAHFSGRDNTSQDASKSLLALRQTLNSSFLPIAVFRALHGSWKVHRKIVSHLPDVPGGVFEGTAEFLPRRNCRGGIDRPRGSAAGDADGGVSGEYEYEYLYSESGVFTLSHNPKTKLDAKRKYIYRYEEDREVVSVWFVNRDGWTSSAEGLFHEVTDFDVLIVTPAATATAVPGVRARGSRHLCGPDTYNTSYRFSFLNSGPELESLSVRYQVQGPRKDYISEATYERAGHVSRVT